MKFIALLSVLTLGSVISQAGYADTTLEFVNSVNEAPITMQIKNGVIRVVSQAQGKATKESVVLFDANTKTMTIINPEQRDYVVITRESMQRNLQQVRQMQQGMVAHMEQMRQQMTAQMENLPPEQRKAMEEQMQRMEESFGNTKTPSPPATYRATGRNKQVAGIACDVYEVLRAGKKTNEVCIASAAALKIPNSDYLTMRAWVEFAAEMQKIAGSLLAGRGGFDIFPNIEGMPVQYVDYTNNETASLKRISTESLDSELFQPPANFKQTEMPTLPGS